jgi:hypothetical protein
MLRELDPKPKVEETVLIPPNLREFLQYVYQLIEAGDEAAIYESDDMLQAESVYGGLIQEGGTLYGFTYFSGEHEDTKFGDAASWEILLDRSDIEEIASGQKLELTLWACQVPLCGNKFSDPVDPCFYHDYVDSPTT